MPINWNRLPDGSLKWEMRAFELQLLAMQERGPCYTDARTINIQAKEVIEHHRAWCEKLAKLHQLEMVKLYYDVLQECLDLANDVLTAVQINHARHQRAHFEGVQPSEAN